ncbi:MAG: hypothetical protein LBG06_12975 [Deltaproteobacteria bacterium]|nr:hypothetical protein [Deltaproteobacteria bacterium]
MDPLALFHGLYQVLGGIAAGPALFVSSLSGRGGGFWLDRLGYPAAGGGRPYWLHAASVGEAGSACAIIRAWRTQEPDSRFVLSVGTPAGRAHAEKSLAGLDGVQFMAPPLDVWGASGRCLDRIEPSALVVIETEIWPGLIRAAARRRVPVVLAAGRISERTARRYGWVRSFFRQTLNSLARLLVISEDDRKRFLSLGVTPDRVEVMGSPKFDGLIDRARRDTPAPPIARRAPFLLVAGSTHPGEEEIILSELLKCLLGRALDHPLPFPPDSDAIAIGPEAIDAWRNFAEDAACGNAAGREAVPGGPGPAPAGAAEGPADAGPAGGTGASAPPEAPGDPAAPPKPLLPRNPFKMIIVPRHANRAREVLALARKKGFGAEIITDPEIPLAELPDLAVFGAVGSLLRLYERCDLAIVGGSFVSGLQGHNPLEPAAVGRASFFGSNMASFHEQARALMERASAKMLLPVSIHSVLSHFVQDPSLAAVSGQRGRAYVASLSPAAPRIALGIRQALGVAGAGGTGGRPPGADGSAAPPPAPGEGTGEGS